MGKLIGLDEPCNIPLGERDRSLLKDGLWPNMNGLKRWTLSDDKSHMSRRLEFAESEIESVLPKVESRGGGRSRGISEAIFRFPNAPVYLTHQARQHQYKIKDRWPNYHTMRVLTKDDLSVRGARHIFLLHNGLNEIKDIAFHYRLANWILGQCDDAACIIRPLPAHLSRYPFNSPFAERPLDEYLIDPASVFRQFLRYMLETQWLLSVLVQRDFYDVTTGCELLLSEAKPGRQDYEALASEITDQANRALGASLAFEGHSKDPIHCEDVLQSVTGLRSLLGWKPVGSDVLPGSAEAEEAAIHTVGYSMGGFVAQSVFCTWPFAVASCSNMFAGGALRDLAPTAFAHPEEWQSVLHGLRSELDQARVEGFFKPKGGGDDSPEHVVGIEREVFDYFNRVFEDVFLQADRGSYSTRLAEFSRRLLFILGGDDPIVQTRNVLDAAPPGGITLHQIGDMSHFPGNRQGERAEKEQREFWLPEAGGMVGRFAERAATLLQQSNARRWGGRIDVGPSREKGESLNERLPDEALSNSLFEHELDRMVDMLEGPDAGWLFIARNQVPTVFLGEHAFDTHAAAMHHSEDLIGDYVRSLSNRAERLTSLKSKLSLLIPEMKASDEIDSTMSDRARFAKSEVAIRFYPDEESNRKMLEHFATEWCDGSEDVVRVVKANEYDPGELQDIGPAWADTHGGSGPIPLTMLPDVWIAFDRSACEELLGVAPHLGRAAIEQGMVELATQLVKDPEVVRGKANKAKKLRALRTIGGVRALRVSTAELNPRYRGRLLGDLNGGAPREMQHLLTYWAMAYRASTPHQAPALAVD